MAYLDSVDTQFKTNNWGIRFRATTDDGNMEISFRRRFPMGVSVGAPPPSPNDINGTLEAARLVGFGSSAKDSYETNFDADYSNWRLTFTNNKYVDDSEKKGKLPGAADCREAALETVPGKLSKAVLTYQSIIQSGFLFGPVTGRRYVGAFMEQKLEIEIIRIWNATKTGYDHIVDISFKDGDTEFANARHEALRSFLATKGWVFTSDVDKYALILLRYAPAAMTNSKNNNGVFEN